MKRRRGGGDEREGLHGGCLGSQKACVLLPITDPSIPHYAPQSAKEREGEGGKEGTYTASVHTPAPIAPLTSSF